MQQPRFVVGERHLTRLGPDAAALTITYSIPHHTPEGRPHTLSGAWTAVFQRRDGRWVIVQEHLSDPPRPAAGTAAPAADSAHAHGAPQTP
jgi:ketosteroid isomerase-like protein